MNEKLELALKAIKTMEDEKSLLDEKIKEERQNVFNVLEDESLGQYKSEMATVSYVERKIVKYEDRDATLKSLQEKELVKYIEEVPATTIIGKQFDVDIKGGVFNIDGVSVDVKKSPMIRFNKS